LTAWQLGLIGCAALGAAYLGVGGIRRWAEGRQVVDIPNARSSHTRPTPRGGGLAIVVVVLGGLLLSALAAPPAPWPVLASYGAGALWVAAVSWVDDLRSVPNRIRFTVHSVAAVIALVGVGVWWTVGVPVFGVVDLGWAAVPITFLWIVGLTNAYNFMDGIDGIAGGQAVLAGMGWVVLGALSGLAWVGLAGLLIAAASIGFLGHNWPPARIFMGDVGSAFLGYTFAVLAVGAAQGDPRLASVGVLLVWPFVFDAAFTFLRRWRRGENVFTAHRSHLYQRLVIAGVRQRWVTLLYVVFALAGLDLAFAWIVGLPGSGVAVWVAIPALALLLWRLVVRQEGRRG